MTSAQKDDAASYHSLYLKWLRGGSNKILTEKCASSDNKCQICFETECITIQKLTNEKYDKYCISEKYDQIFYNCNICIDDYCDFEVKFEYPSTDAITFTYLNSK